MKIFKTTEDCEKYLQLIPPNDRVLFIVNHQMGQEFLPQIHSLRQLFAVYIYSSEAKRYGQWTKDFPKVKTKRKKKNPNKFHFDC